MTKARDLANIISTGNPLADGAIAVAEISDLTASAAELNKLQGVTASTAELNQVVGATSALQTQLDNISVTSGSLTKTFTQNETADITLSQGITSAPVVSATKEVPQTGISSKGAWDVNSTASNYDFHNTATAVTLTPSTSLDLASSTYANVSVGVAGSYGPRFSSDGTKVFMNNQGANYIRQRDLSTPWDLSTTSSVASFSTASQVTDESGFCFSDNGLHFYLADSNYSSGQNLLHQYSITSGYAYDLLNYGSFTRTLNLTSLGESAPSGGAVSTALVEDNGTKMYIFTGSGSSALIRQYTLSTAYDISSATYANKSFDVYADYGSGGYLGNSSLSSDGTLLLLANGADDIVMQYELSTAWDISTASRVGIYNPSEDANVSGVHLKPDNSEFFMLGGSNTTIYKYTLGSSPSLALGSGSFASADVGKRITGNGGDVILTSTGGAFSTTGGSAFTDSSTIAAGSWSMFGLKSAGDVTGITMPIFSETGTGFNSTAALESTTPSAANAYLGNIVDCCISKNGLYLYTVDISTNATISQFTMSTPYDLSTATYTANFSTGMNAGGKTSLAINNDGTKFYATYNQSGNEYLKTFAFGTAYDVTTLNNTNNNSIPVGSGGGGSNNYGGDFSWSADGTKAYFFPYVNWTGNSTVGGTSGSIDNRSGVVYQYNVSTAFDWAGSSPSVNATIRVPLKGDNYASFAVSSDGKYILNHQHSQQYMYVYPLTTPYDISTQDISAEVRIDTQPYNSSGATNQGAIGCDHVNGIFYTASYNNTLVDANRFATNVTVLTSTQQYHVGVTNTSGRIDSSAFTDINGMTAAQSAGTGTVNYAVSTDGRTTWSVAKGTDGVRPIVRNNSGTWQYNNHSSTQGYGTTGISDDSKTFNPSSQHSNPLGITFKPDGTKMYLCSSGSTDITEYNLSTAWDVSTASYNNVSFSHSGLTDLIELEFNNDGTELYALSSGYPALWRIDLSTAYDLSSASFANSAAVQLNTSNVGSVTNPYCFTWKPDGTAVFIYDYNSSPRYVKRYNLSTAWDLTTASITASSQWLDHSSQAGTAYCMYFNNDGTKIWIGASTHNIYEYTLSTAYDLSTASYTATASLTDDMIGFYIKPDGTKLYAVDNDNNIIRQYSMGLTNLYSTSTTWTNGTVNDELYTLQQALLVESNRMDKTQLDAVADANHFSTGNSLDLMIALRMDAAASTLPTSDGVTLNYDAAALNEGAVLGTDYDFFHPAANKVQIKSLAAQNLKVRVV